MTTTKQAAPGTTVRVKTETRDRLNEVAASELGGVSTDEAIAFLLDEHWKIKCIESWDRLREEDPEGWQEVLAEAEELDRGFYTPIDEPPYQSDDPEFLAAGGMPLTKTTNKDVA